MRVRRGHAGCADRQPRRPARQPCAGQQGGPARATPAPAQASIFKTRHARSDKGKVCVLGMASWLRPRGRGEGVSSRVRVHGGEQCGGGAEGRHRMGCSKLKTQAGTRMGHRGEGCGARRGARGTRRSWPAPGSSSGGAGSPAEAGPQGPTHTTQALLPEAAITPSDRPGMATTGAMAAAACSEAGSPAGAGRGGAGSGAVVSTTACSARRGGARGSPARPACPHARAGPARARSERRPCRTPRARTRQRQRLVGRHDGFDAGGQVQGAHLGREAGGQLGPGPARQRRQRGGVRRGGRGLHRVRGGDRGGGGAPRLAADQAGVEERVAAGGGQGGGRGERACGGAGQVGRQSSEG